MCETLYQWQLMSIPPFRYLCPIALKTSRENPECLHFYRTTLCSRGICRRRVSVRPSHTGIVPKWLYVGSCKQLHTIAPVLSFLMPKISAKFQRGHPKQERQLEVE